MPKNGWRWLVKCLMCCIYAWLAWRGGFFKVLPELGAFLSVQPWVASRGSTFSRSTISVLLGLAVIDFMVTVGIARAMYFITQLRREKFPTGRVLPEQFPKRMLPVIAVVCVVCEELIFRGLLLGVVWGIPRLHTLSMFWILMVIGNLCWGLLHLPNFEFSAGWQKVPTVLIHWVAGFWYSFAFVKYGLLSAIILHLAYDGMLSVSRIIPADNAPTKS